MAQNKNVLAAGQLRDDSPEIDLQFAVHRINSTDDLTAQVRSSY